MVMTVTRIAEIRRGMRKPKYEQGWATDAEWMEILTLAQDAIRAREESMPSDFEQAWLWRDLVLLDPMDLMVIFGGAENDVVLLSKLKEWIERKRQEQKLKRSPA